ncbi:MAG: hypothetical protein Q8O40_17830 [Chloroflexota bacterium]|nr:hypothetical protein [Chloroflexota bacterium]
MIQENVVLAEIKAGANVSGYVYLYLPRHLCQTCHVGKGTVFIATYHDGHLVIQQKE